MQKLFKAVTTVLSVSNATKCSAVNAILSAGSVLILDVGGEKFVGDSLACRLLFRLLVLLGVFTVVVVTPQPNVYHS